MTKLLWQALTDAIEKAKHPFPYSLSRQYIDFVDNFEGEKTLSRLYWTDLIHTFDNGNLNDFDKVEAIIEE